MFLTSIWTGQKGYLKLFSFTNIDFKVQNLETWVNDTQFSHECSNLFFIFSKIAFYICIHFCVTVHPHLPPPPPPPTPPSFPTLCKPFQTFCIFHSCWWYTFGIQKNSPTKTHQELLLTTRHFQDTIFLLWAIPLEIANRKLYIKINLRSTKTSSSAQISCTGSERIQ